MVKCEGWVTVGVEFRKVSGRVVVRIRKDSYLTAGATWTCGDDEKTEPFL